MSKKVIKKKRKKLPSIKRLRNKLDALFNKYVRERDGKCIVCGSTEKLCCSHFYGKCARPATRWDTDNAYAMCSACHYRHHHGTEADYAVILFGKYGESFMVDLMNKSLVQVNYTREDYNNMIAKYKALNEKI